MKKKTLFVAALLAVLCMGLANEASAQRWCRPHYGRAYGYYYRPRVWVAPPPPVVIAPPRYYAAPRYYDRGYYRPRYYRAPRYGYGYGYGRGRHCGRGRW